MLTKYELECNPAIARLADIREYELFSNRCFLSNELTKEFWDCLNPRKCWEFSYVAEAARHSGCLNNDATCLGLGVGTEALIFVLANHCAKVVATDLYSTESTWLESRVKEEDVFRHSPIPFRKENVIVESQDMTSLSYPNESVDWIWSCSSVEHVQTLAELYKVFEEIHRVLRPGGYCFLSTEFCINGYPYLLQHCNGFDEKLFADFVENLGGLELVGGKDLSFNFLHPGNAPCVRRFSPAVKVSPLDHFELLKPTGITNMVGLSSLVPLGFTLKKKNQDLTPWQEIPLDNRIRGYIRGVKNVQSDPVEAIRVLEPLLDPGLFISKQHELLILRHILEAASIGRRRLPDKYLPQLMDRMLESLPEGQIQDPDCCDLLAYLLKEENRLEESAYVYKLCMLSPSTARDHVARLTRRYCNVMAKLGSREEAQELGIMLKEEIAEAGYAWEDTEMSTLRKLVRLKNWHQAIKHRSPGRYLQHLKALLGRPQ